MAKLFGFSIEDGEELLSPTAVSPIPPNNEDGSDHYLTSGFFGSYVILKESIELNLIFLRDIVKWHFIQSVIVLLKIL